MKSVLCWLAAGLVAMPSAWGAERARIVFDREGGFTAVAGEEVRIGARVEGGGGYGISRWEGNAPGRSEGRRSETWVVDTAEPGEYWLRAVGWCDGTDGEVRGMIRFRVAGAVSAEARGRQEGETEVWSEDFSTLNTASSTELTSWNGWTGSKMFNGTNCLKVGSGKASGEAVSPDVEMAGTSGRAEFSLRGYGGDGTTVDFSGSVDGGEWSSWGTYSSLSATAEVYSVAVPSCQSLRLKWTGTGKRFHLGDVAVYRTAGGTEALPPGLDLDPGETAVELIPGQTYSLTATATEFDGDLITLGASGLPAGAEWEAEDPKTGSVEGQFAWAPTETGTWTVLFSATDKDGTTEKTVTFTVVPEGPGKLSFASDALNVLEGAGVAVIPLVRTGGSVGNVTAILLLDDGTAVAGRDYAAGTVFVDFADGQTTAEARVALIDDDEAEANKTFRLRLGTSGGASLGAITTCTVTIVDDDDATASYYANCFKNGVLKTGSDLKDALCKIINTGVKTNLYRGSLDDILRVTDANSTNGSGSQVRCIYLQEGITLFNKEHLWAQSHGIDERDPAYGDLHHIRACDITMNSKRGNLDFDNCRGVSGAGSLNGCYYTGKAWEPPDAAKGDVARALLYMDVRYENKYNSKMDLELVDFVGTTADGNQMGKLSTLLAWNELDPPDDFERRRNDLIYTTYQYNRNPFIDHPTWARAVFNPEHFEGESVVWTVSVTTSGEGWVNNQNGTFSSEVTNGLTKTYYVRPGQYWYIGSIAWDGTVLAPGLYTNADYYNYVTPAVTNNARLEVAFAEDTAALGTPVWWLAQYGYSADWDAAELADLNGDGVPNWQEYVNGTDPDRLVLPKVTGVGVSEVTESGFTVGWTATELADGYRVKVCETSQVAAASTDFEDGGAGAEWMLSEHGAKVMMNSAMTGQGALVLSTNGAWLATGEVENPVAVTFLYRRSSNTDAWGLEVQVSEDDGVTWSAAGCVTNAMERRSQRARIELSAWAGRTVCVRLVDARPGGDQAERYLDEVTVWRVETATEGTVEGSGTTSWRTGGLEAGTGYDVLVRAEAEGVEPGLWSEVLRVTTSEAAPKLEQTITFGPIGDQLVGATVTLEATASSQLPVSYVISGPATLSGEVLTCVSEGMVFVTARQEGNATWAAAPDVRRRFRVSTMTPAEAYAAWLEGRGLNEATEGLGYDEEHVADFDGDGVPNWKEYVADTNPADSNEFFYVTLHDMADSGDGEYWDISLKGWNASPERVYTLLYYESPLSEPVEGDTNSGDEDLWFRCIPYGFLRVRVDLPWE